MWTGNFEYVSEVRPTDRILNFAHPFFHVAMSTFTRFEDILAWRQARQLCADIYDVTSVGGFAQDFVLKDQIRRAGNSVVLNIAEGFGRGGVREFHRFLLIARGSLAEVQAALYLALDLKYINHQEFDRISQTTAMTGRMITRLCKYLRSKTG